LISRSFPLALNTSITGDVSSTNVLKRFLIASRLSSSRPLLLPRSSSLVEQVAAPEAALAAVPVASVVVAAVAVGIEIVMVVEFQWHWQ
jgi:hypothetical protein